MARPSGASDTNYESREPMRIEEGGDEKRKDLIENLFQYGLGSYSW